MHPLRPQLPRGALDRCVAVLLAGGQGSRLHELTDRECKPAIPLFATGKGPVRMVDFTMANIVRSGLSRVIVATQYKPATLAAHVLGHWGAVFPAHGLTLRDGLSVRGLSGYGGTADAVAANIPLIDENQPTEVIVLSGDHLYQMDYSAMIAAHRASGAAVTIAVDVVDFAHAGAFGVVEVDRANLITTFAEKPAQPRPSRDIPGAVRVSMGVYVFDWAWLRATLATQQNDADFGHDILPDAVSAGVAHAYQLPVSADWQRSYWRDVGTVDSLRCALLDFTVNPPFILPTLPGPLFAPLGGHAGDILSEHPGTVFLPGAKVMVGARLVRALIAPGTFVPADVIVGEDAEEDARWFRRTADGTTLVTNAMLARRSGRAIYSLQEPLRKIYVIAALA